LSTGAAAGIGVGATIAVLALGGAALYVLRKHKKRAAAQPSPEVPQEPVPVKYAYYHEASAQNQVGEMMGDPKKDPTEMYSHEVAVELPNTYLGHKR
jgi:hypothetical protein